MRIRLLVIACCLVLSYGKAIAQANKCGAQIFKESLIAKDPAFAQQLEQRMEAIRADAAAYTLAKKAGVEAKTTGTGTIPVIFHIVLDSAHFNLMGGINSLIDRADSQMVVINRDFNAQNADSTQIPTAFKPLYANAGIHFGLAHRTPTGAATPGYEITITSVPGFSDVNSAYSTAKHSSSNGADIWDPSTYLNVWIINPQGASGLIGLTAPESYITNTYPQNEEGIIISFGAFGVLSPITQGTYFVNNITGGRTLTHELGHFFEIWHTWGDDNGLCPNNGGADDGIADTPPQANYTNGCPSFPQLDACSNTSPGIMFMNYMDYTNDDCMHLFTIDQAAQMIVNVQPGGESYSLTQHPDVLTYPVSVSQVEKEHSLNVYPSPSTGLVNISFNEIPDGLESIRIVNTLGQEVRNINTINQQNTHYSFDLSMLARGVYFVQCRFTGASISKKILLQ